MNNFNSYKFRASSVGNLFVGSKTKGELFGETAKSYLSEIYIEVVYGRKKQITTKYFEKGNLCEDEAIELVERVKFSNEVLMKNSKRFENDLISGTPDLITNNSIIDTKCSFDIFTFHNAESNKLYYYQMQSYMLLTGKKESSLAFCLVDTPPHILANELSKVDINLHNEITKIHTFADIPEKNRVKFIPIDFDVTFESELNTRVLKAREYLNSLSL